MELEIANSIVTVGDGRGFVVAGPRENKLIVTAAILFLGDQTCRQRSVAEFSQVTSGSLASHTTLPPA